jgi:hypothetical protein
VTQPLKYVGDRILAQEHSAKHGLFCGLVLRRLAPEILRRRLDVEPRMPAIIHDSHAASSPPLKRSNMRSIVAIVTVSQTPDRHNFPDAGIVSRRPTLDVAGETGKAPCL